MSVFELSNEKTLNESAKSGGTAFLNSNSLPISFQTKILTHDENHIRLKNNVPYEYILQFNEGSLYELNTGIQKYSTEKVQSDGENIMFSIKDSQTVVETRNDSRTYFQSDDQVYCIIKNPYDKVTHIKKNLIDISNGGFGLTTDFDSKLFNPKTIIDECIIFTDHQKHIKCSCEVVYKKKYHSLLNKTSLQVGFKYLEKESYDKL